MGEFFQFIFLCREEFFRLMIGFVHDLLHFFVDLFGRVLTVFPRGEKGGGKKEGLSSPSRR